MRLLDLSTQGARITHRAPLQAGGIAYVDLPPAFGAVRLAGRLMWTRLRRTERTQDGDRRALYESGLAFTSLTSAKQAALAEALATLQPAPAVKEREHSP